MLVTDMGKGDYADFQYFDLLFIGVYQGKAEHIGAGVDAENAGGCGFHGAKVAGSGKNRAG